jgi:hypothetical protein
MAMAAGQFSISNTSVQVKSTTWASDSRDLFDYEVARTKSSAVKTGHFDLPGSAKISWVDRCVMPVDRHQPLPAGAQPLLQLDKRNGTFVVDGTMPSGDSRGWLRAQLWLVVKDLATTGYELSAGDVIRMGSSRFRVRQLVADSTGKVCPEVTLPASLNDCSVDDAVAEGSTCRICLEGGDEEGPLIQPCACKGSVESVHLGCLQKWIRCRMGLLDDKEPRSIFVKPMDCDLCKKAYPSHVCFNGERRQLVEVPQPDGPFVVLEKLAKSKSGNSGAGILVAAVTEDKPLTFGRSHDVGFRVDDISISRFHAQISFREGKFFLEDNNSRFGTLVCMRRPYELSPGEAVSIQTGSTILSLKLKSEPDPTLDGFQDHCSECSTEEDIALVRT